MLTSLTVPLAVVLLGLPGFGIFSGFKKPTRVPTAADSLPPAWKPASRLALENRFVRAALPRLGGPVSLRLPTDPRQLRVSFDADSGALSVVPEMGEISLGMGARKPLGQYARDLTQTNFQRLWAERSRASINSLGANTPSTASRPGLSLPIPVTLPRFTRSFLGPGGPALNVSGTENIRISGTSNWTNQQTGPLGQKRSLFPSLDMQQDLDIRLEGQLSDRVKVNLLQNSGVQIPLANRIAINYRGEEDDLVQQLDLGNTNLTLPGTQFVSYSGKNEGLFGVKATTRLGPLDFTLLTSKQEGRSERANYAGGASRQNQSIRDLDYLKGTYFLLYDPNGFTYDVLESSIEVYLDDGNNYNDINTVRGRAVVDPAGPDSADADPDGTRGVFAVRGTFARLNPGPGQDYEVLSDVYGPNFKVIRLARPMAQQSQQALAVTYSRRPVDAEGRGIGEYQLYGGQDTTDTDGSEVRVMKLLWAPPNLMRSGSTAYFDTSLTLTAVRDLELRNFYQLGGQRIDPQSLKIAIRKGVDQPPVVTLQTPEGSTIPYIEVLGLDNFNEESGTPVIGHDARVDGTFATSNTRLFVDYENGVLFFFELRPFAPRITGDGARRFEQALAGVLNRRATLADVPGEGNPDIYEKYVIERDTDARYHIDVEFNAARASGEISLGRSNIVEGSDVVTINGQALARDRDYTIDYDLGRVTLKRQLGPADQLNIDYAYAPLFAQAGKTLIGSAFRLEGLNRSLGGAFMYESKGAQDLRPRLGEEPSRSLIGDLNTAWAFKPEWLTRAVDKLPWVRTATGSELRFEAEVGASFPNPNTRNEVYIDDMEGVRDAVSLSMGYDRWRWSSVPTRPTAVVNGLAVGPRTMLELEDEGRPLHNAELHWFTPYSVVKEKDLKPTLSRAQGAENNRQALALSVPRYPLSATPGDTLWVGLTYVLDQAGLDLSKSQFIELWVNDFNDVVRMRDRHVRLNIDLGVVSEDQMRSPDVRPNRRLDSEDQEPRDNSLSVGGSINEDTGLDNWLLPTEQDSIPGGGPFRRDLVTSSDVDPQGDNFDEPNDDFQEVDPRRWVFVNGTEDNKQVLPYPDTEDLNLNNNIDTDEDFFRFTIDLGDTAYVVTDVQRDYRNPPPNTPIEYPPQPNNGWRRYRIPIGDSRRVQFGAPDLTLTRHVRFWIDGLTATDAVSENVQFPLLMLGGFEIVGSRWRLAALDTADVGAGTTVTLNSVNSVDNAEVYVAPFDPGQTRSGSEGFTRREQSIALEFTELQPDSAIEAFKTFSIDENYSRYGRLEWFATGFDVQNAIGAFDATGLEYFVRFASDEIGRNYYEYRAPVPSSGTPRGIAWSQISLPLTELSGLKLTSSDDTIRAARHPGAAESLIVIGRPSFTRLRRVSFGLVNRSGQTFRAGQLWFNELRATEVAKDKGHAQRVIANGNFANLMRYNLSWNGRSADFLSVGETRGSGNSSNDFTLGTTVDLHRFFEGTGIVLPVTFNFYQRRSTPRFSVGDDLVRTGALASASETFSDGRNWQTSYQRTWSERSNRLLRYTIGGITAQASGSNSHDHNPNNLSRGKQFQAAVNYQIAPRSLLAVPLPFTRARFFPLPERFFWNYTLQNSTLQSSDRVRSGDSVTIVPRAPVIGRQGMIRFGSDSRPFDFFQHTFSAERNLRLSNELLEQIGFINLGRVVRWNQSMNARHTLSHGAWVRPTLSWRSTYYQDNGPELSSDLSLRAIRNSQSVTMGWSLPFDGLAARSLATSPMAARPAGAPRDSVLPPPPPKPRQALWRTVLARIGNVTTDGSMNWSSAHSRLTGTPGLPYLLGITRNPEAGGRDVQRAFGNTSERIFDWRASARTRLTIGLGAAVTTTAEFGSQRSNRNALETRRDNIRFPDFQVDYGKVANAIRLDRLLTNPRLQTGYSSTRNTDWTGENKNTENVTSSWQPLLGIEGDFKNGARFSLKLSRRVTKRLLFQLGQSVATDRNTDVTVGVNRSYTQGQKVSFLGKNSTVKSTINLGLSAAYDRQSGETVQQGDTRPRFPTRRDRLSVNGNGTYGFSNNVSGTLSLGFLQNRDLEREIVNRSIRVELSARFSF